LYDRERNLSKKEAFEIIELYKRLEVYNLTCKVPFERCKIIAFLVRSQVLKNGKRAISSPARGAIVAPAC
jgi:hypothetical protein